MTLRELLPELLKLTHEEMIEAIQILQREVTIDEYNQLKSDTFYEIWSPQITPETGRQLLNMLQEDKKKNG
jgi:hypothetical protein